MVQHFDIRTRSKKNDFTVIAFTADAKPLKYQFVHDIETLWTWLVSKGYDIKYFNVYNRRDRSYLGRYSANN